MEALFSEAARRVYVNPVQLKVNIVNAKTTVLVGGRALGKTTGIHAPRLTKCLMKMPFSSNAFVSRTYKQFKTRIMGSLIGGIKDLGFKEWDEKKKYGHFTIGRKNKNFPSPKYDVGDYTNCIHWFTGAVVTLISQDKPGDGNGSNIQSLFADEAYQLDKKGLDEDIIPALRGLSQYANLNEYKQITLTTSMPLLPEAAWIFDYEKDTDAELNYYLLQVYDAWYRTYNLIHNKTKNYTPLYLRNLKAELGQLESILNEIRPDYTYYLEADSFENYHVLGEGYFKTARRNLGDAEFNTQIGNLRPQGIDKGKRFYGQLASHHFYIDHNNTYFDKFDLVMPDGYNNCNGDNDCDRSEPLLVSVDYGGHINSMIVCQDKHNSFNYINEFFSLQEDGEWIDHMLEKFIDYYRPMNNRTVYYYDDSNGNRVMPNSNETLRDTAIRKLTEAGFIVHVMDVPQNPFHQDKWELMNLALNESDKRLPLIRINESNCPNAKIALFNAPIKTSEKGVKQKVKSSEIINTKAKKKTNQKQATHITDCFDYIYYHKFRSNIDEVISGFAPIMS